MISSWAAMCRGGHTEEILKDNRCSERPSDFPKGKS